MQCSCGRYLYVAYTSQQAIEKLLKAYFVKEFKTTPPYTHNLLRLISEIKITIPENFLRLASELNAFYLEGRYSEELGELISNFKFENAKLLLKSTNEFYLWLSQILK
jgi:HEPN domain-containing protein